jgi:hypothetical protein
LTLIDAAEPTRSFKGYHQNSGATNKKIAQNVFKAGMSPNAVLSTGLFYDPW